MEETSAFDEAPATNNAALNGLLEQAEELISLEAQISDLEQLLKRLGSRATDLKTKTIPDKMAEIGISEFATPAGAKLKVEDFVSGSLPKEPEKRSTAIGLLERWGADGIIRNEITLAFDKSQHNAAMALADDLRKQGFNAEVKSGVHPQTYLAFIRERLASGEEVDAEAMGIFVGRKTKVVMPKAPKGAQA